VLTKLTKHARTPDGHRVNVMPQAANRLRRHQNRKYIYVTTRNHCILCNQV